MGNCVLRDSGVCVIVLIAVCSGSLHWPCGCTHVVFALWVVPNVPCLYLVRSVNWGGLCCCVLC